MNAGEVEQAIQILTQRPYYEDLNLVSIDDSNPIEKSFEWPGSPAEDVVVKYHDAWGKDTPYHRHDFFFFNYQLAGSYDTIDQYGETIDCVKAGDLLVGQPYAGHGSVGASDQRVKIVNVLVRKDAFFKSVLPAFASCSWLLHFFLDPYENERAEECVLLHPGLDHPIHEIVELMLVTYAFKQPGYLEVMRSLVMVFASYMAQLAEADASMRLDRDELSDVYSFIDTHLEDVTLGSVAERFSYNPNYLSDLIHKKAGKTFTAIVLERRMSRCAALLRTGSFSVEEIARQLGYASTSNFYRTFRSYYGMTPKQFVRQSPHT